MVERNVIHWRVCDYFSQVLAEKTLRTDTSNPTRLLAELAMLCRELMKSYPDLLGIGLGFPRYRRSPARLDAYFIAPRMAGC
ncbi:Uncharacterised protein [Pantoea agglomerans]|uniref:Uncharacterized protein n=1 Tax=Enterobacter agglomerans TaxID=549 RepID=A0A379A8H2_ENTAG|nr:Uncharacterised protein [Pantoea agglomerans]